MLREAGVLGKLFQVIENSCWSLRQYPTLGRQEDMLNLQKGALLLGQ